MCMTFFKDSLLLHILLCRFINTKKINLLFNALPIIFFLAVFNPVRKLVSADRTRFEQDGFSLDLSYITDRIIGFFLSSFSISILKR